MSQSKAHLFHRLKFTGRRPRRLPGTDLRMSTLARFGRVSPAKFRAMVAEYRTWIDRLGTSIADGETDVPSRLIGVAADHIADARTAAARIEAGIELLAADPEVFKAFRLANHAMQMQRARQDWVRSGAEGQIDSGVDQGWYPFQIAYILLNIPGLAGRNHQDRELADLLWFPTGGGKTEAYLGLLPSRSFFAAFEITRHLVLQS